MLTMKLLRLGVISLALVSTALISGTGTADAKKKKRMTCSFIAKQCVKQCSKEVDRVFCGDFCGMEKQNCKDTGRWETMGHRFDNVIRR